MERVQNRRALLSAMLSFIDQAVYPPAVEELEEDLSQEVGAALIAGDAMIPGYIMRTISGPRNDSDRLDIIAGLRAERVLDDPKIAHWFLANRERYPAFASYLVHLECMRQFALNTLTR